MAEGFITRRGGGGSVRTPIITITSETELPADPKPGTIAILTTTPIGCIYAQTSTPESPSVGDLWFSPSAVANVVYIDGKEAYAVKTVRQYNGTAWETVNAFQYIDGAWSTMVYLLKGIDECKPITGGWKAIAIRRASSWTDSETQAPEVEKIDGGIILTQSASGYKSGAYHTTQQIDVSGYDVLCIQGEMTIKNRGEVRLVSAVGPYSESNTVLYEELPSSGAIDIKLDVSGLTGDYYVLFDVATDGDTSTILTLTKIWLYKATYLFDNGDQYEAVTGGWTSKKGSGGVVTFGSTQMTLTYMGNSDRTAALYTAKKIKISGSKLYCTVDITANGQFFEFGIASSVTSSETIGFVSKSTVQSGKTGSMTVTIDTSGSVDKEYYVVARTYGATTANISKVWMA